MECFLLDIFPLFLPPSQILTITRGRTLIPNLNINWFTLNKIIIHALYSNMNPNQTNYQLPKLSTLSPAQNFTKSSTLTLSFTLTRIKTLTRMCNICDFPHVSHAWLHICFTCACDTYVIHACYACVTGVSFHMRFTCVYCITQIPYFKSIYIPT